MAAGLHLTRQMFVKPTRQGLCADDVEVLLFVEQQAEHLMCKVTFARALATTEHDGCHGMTTWPLH